jgi:TPR repeat protein
LYERGKDLPKNEVLAKQWFKKAADQGDTEGKQKLAQVEQKDQM